MRRSRFFFGAVLAVLGFAPLHAQTPTATGTVRGRVTDAATQQGLAGVTVTLGGRGARTQSDGSYSIKPGVVYGYPCTTKNGQYEIVQGLKVDDFSRGRMDATEKELREERAAIEDLLR